MFHLHTATDLSALADRLGEVLSDAPADAFERDWVAVPSAAMRTWLSLRLATRLGTSGPGRTDGVAANVEFSFPGALRAAVLGVGSGSAGAADPWEVGPLTWAVLECGAGLDHMPPALRGGAAGPPGGAEAGGSAARYAAARQVADLFDRYHVHRPAMVRSWAAGTDCDASLAPLAEPHLWQPTLWRAVRAMLGTPSPAERMVGLLEGVRAGRVEVDLPSRVCVFGFSVLPGGADLLGLLDALGVGRDVHLFLPQPCAELGPIAARVARQPVAGVAGVTVGRPREEVDAVELFHHPLLRSWARPHLETAVLLADGAARGIVVDATGPPTEGAPGHGAPGHGVPGHGVPGHGAPGHGVPGDRAPNLLDRLRADILADRAPDGSHDLAPSDRSVQFHAAQGPTRQVEVLRDAICALLADELLGLTEEDVLVVCPDLPRFAPVIESVWGETAHRGRPVVPPADRAPRLRYRIADRGMTSANPVAMAAAALLEVAEGRFDAPAVVDLLAADPVRTRMGLSEGDVATISAWVADTRVRWGRDGSHRDEWGVVGDPGADRADAESNTWSAGMARLMAGMAVSTEHEALALGGHPPLAVEGSDTTVLGRLAEALWRLERLAADLDGPAPVTEWVERLGFHFGELLAPPAEAPWQMERVRRVLGSIRADVEASGCDPVLWPAEVRRLLDDRLAGQSGSVNFFRGGVTVTSATPMRWVPHRVVCLLGSDQSVLGAGTLDGDDLLMASPVVGDRNPAAESRQFLLEAVLCTGSHLVVIRDGRDVRTNHAVPPAVALAELRAAVQHTVSAAVVDPADDADPLRPAASPEEVLHPRQAFSERCLAPGRLVTGTVWSFDPAARDAALARRRRAARFTTFAESPLARPDDAVIALDDLRSVLRRPIATFLADVLDLRLPRRSDALDGVLPTAIDSLDRYGVATALVDALDRAGIVPHDEAGAAEVVERWQRRERRLGRVPVTGLSRSDMAALAEEVRTARSSADDLGYRPWTEGSPEVVDADVVVDGTRIVGELRCDLVDGRPGPASLRMSRQKDTDRIAGWIDLLVLHAVDPSRPWRWVAVRRGSGGGKKRRPSKSSSKSPGPSVVELELAPSAPSPEEALSVVVDLYHRARREPLPIFADLSPALAQGAADLATAWPGRFPDPAETAVYGDLDVWDLLGLPTLARDGVPLDAGRARHYAQRLWGTLRLCTRDVGADEADRWDGSTHGDGGGDG